MRPVGEWSRRHFLWTLGASFTTGAAGCNRISDQSGPDTQTPASPPSSAQAPSLTPTQTQTSTSEAEPTESPTRDQMEVNPLIHDKLIGAHYYPWYHGGSNWTADTPAHPTLGDYNSGSSEVINQHIKWAVEHGINWFSVSWDRYVNPDRDRILREDFLKADLASEINISLLYESVGRFHHTDEGLLDFDRQTNRRLLREDFQYFEDTYFDQSNYLEIDDRPVVFFYSASTFTGGVKEAFQEAKDEIDTDPYLVADFFSTAPSPLYVYEDWMEEFDAASLYNIYTPDAVEGRDFDEFIEHVERKTLDWYLKSDNAGMDFIPNVIPGYNDTLIRDNPVLERSPNDFRQFCRSMMKRLDQDLDAILVTSFNEWPEYTAVEPAKGYGTTYLEVIEEELARRKPEYIEAASYTPLALDFNKTIDPEGGLPRSLSLLLGSMELENKGGETVASYNIGVAGQEPIFVEGAYSPDYNEEGNPETGRWLGGPTSRSLIYLEPDLPDVATALFRGKPVVDDEIEADVYFNNQRTDHIAFGERALQTYSVSLVA